MAHGLDTTELEPKEMMEDQGVNHGHEWIEPGTGEMFIVAFSFLQIFAMNFAHCCKELVRCSGVMFETFEPVFTLASLHH